MHNVLIIGGSNGIGLSMALLLIKKGHKVTVVDRTPPDINITEKNNLTFVQVNLLEGDYSFIEGCQDIDTLIYTAGFGRVAKFETILPAEIDNLFKVNTIPFFQVVRHYYDRMLHDNFFCCVMGSIAGLVTSPLFSMYGATKAAICNGAESLNIELERSGSNNRILVVSPGSIKGTRFNGGENNINATKDLPHAEMRL